MRKPGVLSCGHLTFSEKGAGGGENWVTRYQNPGR
jgi:hypothetical protein